MRMYVRSTAGIHMYAGAFHRNEIVPHFFTRSPADDTTSQLAELKVLGPADASTGDRSVEAGPPLPSPFLLASLASDRAVGLLLRKVRCPICRDTAIRKCGRGKPSTSLEQVSPGPGCRFSKPSFCFFRPLALGHRYWLSEMKPPANQTSPRSC
ncbi:hypothetical protein HDV57DRAFT_390970 [Trichoderma longibrachiatum]|uniref:Uncharacterized protein n=1 Tax=Trichoderma longibrachiatum ATCC 18648 TaxID=983965 RepID=A0A2T4C3R5_TRILO|nr:hypothetical protein M440DRAFT_1247637 [Trichoderma longibrachiatum ATCC 18648]